MSELRITVKDVHDLLKLEPVNDERYFVRLSNYEEAGLESIVFAQDAASFERALASGAGLVLAPLDIEHPRDSRVVRVKNPKYAFAVCGHWLNGYPNGTIHPSAMIDVKATIGHGTSVGAGCVIEAGAYVGECSSRRRFGKHGIWICAR